MGYQDTFWDHQSSTRQTVLYILGVPPCRDGVSMETRAVISCMLMCWEAKSKGGREEAEDGGQQPLPGEDGGEEGRRTFCCPELWYLHFSETL